MNNNTPSFGGVWAIIVCAALLIGMIGACSSSSSSSSSDYTVHDAMDWIDNNW